MTARDHFDVHDYEDLDDRVAEWHSAPEGSEAASMPLHQWLGMTEDEYKAWVEQR